MCIPPYPPTDECDAVTPSCACMKWKYAGVSNSSVVAVSEFSYDNDCIDFIIKDTGTVTFYWEMTRKWPVLPPGLLFPLVATYNEWPLRYSHPLTYYAHFFMHENCVPDIFDASLDCVVQHTFVVTAGTENWKTIEEPGVVRDEVVDRVVVTTVFLLIAVTMAAMLVHVVLIASHDVYTE